MAWYDVVFMLLVLFPKITIKNARAGHVIFQIQGIVFYLI